MKALIIFLVSKCLSRCLDFCELSAMTAAYWNRNCGTKNWKILSPLEEPLGDPNLKTPHPEIQDELPPEVRNFGSNMGVSENRGTPKSSILTGFSIIFTIHFGVFPPILGNTHILPTFTICHVFVGFPELFCVAAWLRPSGPASWKSAGSAGGYHCNLTWRFIDTTLIGSTGTGMGVS